MSDLNQFQWTQETTLCAFEVELTVQQGPSAGERHVLTRFPAYVGRGSDADVQLATDADDRMLSRRHVRISIEGGRVVLADVSTNGTWVGQRHLKTNESVMLSGGEPVWLGPRTMIKLRLLGPTLAPPVESETAAILADVPPPVSPPSSAAAPPNESTQALIDLSIEVLGQTRVRAGDIDVQVLPARKAMVLLACLADGPVGRAVSADRLTDLLWPDNLTDAKAALQATVSRLRRAFRAASSTLPDPVDLTSGGYRLAPPYLVRLDARRFEQTCDEAEHHLAAHHKTEGAAAFERAIALYHGPFLEGHVDDWVQNRRRTLEGRYFDAVDTLGELRVADGTPISALRLFEGALEREPCRERSMLGLMRALSAVGRREEALRRYGDFTRILKKQMGLSPGPELLVLYETMRGQADD